MEQNYVLSQQLQQDEIKSFYPNHPVFQTKHKDIFLTKTYLKKQSKILAHKSYTVSKG